MKNKVCINTIGRMAMALLLLGAMLASCREEVVNPTLIDRYPVIFPDYIDVTIPDNIAPMNFCLVDDKGEALDLETIDVVVRGGKSGEIHVQGDYADFPLDQWHGLLEENKGEDLTFTVCAKTDGGWTQYKDFAMHISPYPLTDWGITYRTIAPGYEVGGYMGVYQRDIHNFDEYAILNVTAVTGQCINCHTPNRGKSDEYLIHLRGDKGGTIVKTADRENPEWLNTKTDSTVASMSYSGWHPSGRYIASAVGKVHQLFRVGDRPVIEVFDYLSDVVILDVTTNQLILSPLLRTDDYETYPVFSANGDTLYYCTARWQNLPAEIEELRYSLCKVAFDSQTGIIGNEVDTIRVDGQWSMDDSQSQIQSQDSATVKSSVPSVTLPRPSYDGKWIMCCLSDYGIFPINHKEADLWLYNLATRQWKPLTAANSFHSESFHSWSTDSHWFVFSSRRTDGTTCNAFFSVIDDDGNASRPFLLPQQNPLKYYQQRFESFNCPEFINAKVDFDPRAASHECLNGKRKSVSVR